MLAARLCDQPLTAVYQWLSTGQKRTGGRKRLAAAGHELAAQALLDVMNQPDKQRAGVFGTARKNVSFLADPTSATGSPTARRPAPFDTDALPGRTDTLYSLSGGTRSAGPLTLL